MMFVRRWMSWVWGGHIDECTVPYFLSVSVYSSQHQQRAMNQRPQQQQVYASPPAPPVSHVSLPRMSGFTFSSAGPFSRPVRNDLIDSTQRVGGQDFTDNAGVAARPPVRQATPSVAE